MEKYKIPYLLGFDDGINGSSTTVLAAVLFPVATPAMISLGIIKEVGGRGLTSAISMGTDVDNADECTTKGVSFMKGVATALGYLTSAVIPALGFIFGETKGIIWFIPVAFIMLVIIAKIDVKHRGFERSMARTMLFYCLAVGAGLLVPLFIK